MIEIEMTLISVHGWARLLYIIVEANGQPWLAESTLTAGPIPLHEYSREEFLTDWTPKMEARQ